MVKTKEECIFQIIANIVMAIFSFCALLPIVLLFTCSLTANDNLLRDGYNFIPRAWSFENYAYIFDTSSSKVLHAYFISCGGTVLGTGSTMLVGYSISRPGMPGRGVITFLVFLTMLFNGGLVPTYINYTTVFHLKNTFFGLLIPSLLMNAFNVMLVKSYFITSIPEEILESARIDGAGESRIFASISAPMARLIIAKSALFVGSAYWNDGNNGYIYLTSATDLYSIQNLLNRMQENLQFLVTNSAGLSSTNVGLANIPSEGIRMSIAVLGVLPVVLVYPFIQNNFIKGITLGGVKG